MQQHRAAQERYDEAQRLLAAIPEEVPIDAGNELQRMLNEGAPPVNERLKRVFSSFRIGWTDEDTIAVLPVLERARLTVPDAKTAKGVREVEVPVWLVPVLREHYEQRLRDGFPMGPKDHFFGTVTGKRRDPDRFRDRILARAVAVANERRAEQGLAPLSEITPHSLRRTWAMFAAQAGRDPHWISDQIGHTSAAFTLQVYQQTRHRRLTSNERQAIWELMRFADEPERCPFTR